MCEIMTVVAALAFTVLHFAAKLKGRHSPAVFTTMLMFWGAALMWSVDCIANRMEGEPLLDMSREDAILGFIVVGAGLVAFAVFSLCARLRPNTGSSQLSR